MTEGAKSALRAANTPPEAHVEPPVQPETAWSLLPEEKRENIKKILAKNRKKIANEKQEMLFNILQKPQDRDGDVFFRYGPTYHPTDSLYMMLENLKDKTVADPFFVQTFDEKGLPTKTANMIPAYDAFVKYIAELWKLLTDLPDIGTAINDFILHRAAYIFVTEDHRKTGVCWHDPKTFIEFCYEEAKYCPKLKMKTIWKPMLGQLSDVYIPRLLGWDKTLLKNSETYKAEIEFTEFWGLKVRSELFPSQRASKGFLDFKANKRAKYNAEKKEQQEKQHILAVQRKLELEQKEKEKAEEKKRQKQVQEWQFVETFTAMTAKERRAEFAKYSPTMMQVCLENMHLACREELIDLMTPTERKHFGVKKMTANQYFQTDAFKK